MYKLDVLAAIFDDIEIAITLDYSKLTSNLFHVTVSLKVVNC